MLKKDPNNNFRVIIASLMCVSESVSDEFIMLIGIVIFIAGD